MLLFALPAAATLTIWKADPLADSLYECCIFLLAGWAVTATRPGRHASHGPGLLLAAIALWGFGQMATGATVYRSATLAASLRYAALAASALTAYLVLRSPAVREGFLRAWAWFGVLLALTGVAAYFTSPGLVLWSIPSPYPDVWGPFLSRNNFAQFLELVFPVVVYLAATAGTGRSRWGYGIAGGILLAAGFLSASRAGAAILVAEALVAAVLAGRSRRTRWSSKPLAAVAVATALILAVSGGTLASRLREPDPLSLRREIFQSATQIIAARPWQGYGLGTFRDVYPQFAVFDAGRTVEHAHGDWLEWTVEGGLGFALLWLAGFLLALRGAWRTMWGIGVPAVFLHALVDDPFARTGVAAWVFILAGAMETVPPPRNDNLQQRRNT